MANVPRYGRAANGHDLQGALHEAIAALVGGFLAKAHGGQRRRLEYIVFSALARTGDTVQARSGKGLLGQGIPETRTCY